ncbi:F-box protein cpr1 [Thalictrum thalictroides]|uniref:F-box protein cpr1 n=1 Tax=Thalictrum thalictroides TaxID=46969 RepID=A0A7J6VN27_THATH|nr:F-box protein cpr1 [Thalictrum thalictroides]
MNLFLQTEYEGDSYSVEGDTFNEAMEINDPFKIDYFNSIRVLGSCNGIVCLSKGNQICLMNPLTREYKIMEEKEEGYCFYNIHRNYGLGYDDTTEDFKLVEIVYFDHFSIFYSRISVCSFKNYSWSTISNIHYWKVNKDELGIYLQGSLHWVGTTSEPNSSKRIVCVDIKKNIVREMFGPVALDCDAETKLGVLGGQLCVICTWRNYYYIDVWAMKDYGCRDSWYKLFSIDKPFQFSVGQHMGAFFFCANGKILQKNDSKHIVYDPKQKVTTVESFEVPKLNIVPYVASLVSLNIGSYARVRKSCIGTGNKLIFARNLMNPQKSVVDLILGLY